MMAQDYFHGDVLGHAYWGEVSPLSYAWLSISFYDFTVCVFCIATSMSLSLPSINNCVQCK